MSDDFKQLYKSDLFRYGGGVGRYRRRFHYWLRLSQTSKNRGLKKVIDIIYRTISERHGIEIHSTAIIGKGLYLGHPFNITINGSAIVGENCNIHKGVTIGRENRGKRAGAPKLGDDVWIGTNAVIVGDIEIGNNVLIAPNTFVNCDIPNDSIVFGNPCVVKHSVEATKEYINNRI